MRRPKLTTLLILCAALALPSSAAAQGDRFTPNFQYDFFGAFGPPRGVDQGTGLELGFDLLEPPGNNARPPDVERLRVRSDFAFRFDPDIFRPSPSTICPSRQRLGSFTIAFDHGNRGAEVYNGRICNGAGNFVMFVPFEPVTPSAQPFQIPPPIRFRLRDDDGFGRLDLSAPIPNPCPDPGQTECSDESSGRLRSFAVNFRQRARRRRFVEDFIGTPPACPRDRTYDFIVEAQVEGSEFQSRHDYPCLRRATPRPDCAIVASHFGAIVNPQTGEQFSRPFFQVDATCNVPILGISATVEGKPVERCEDQAGNSCAVTNTFDTDDTAVFPDTPANESWSFSVTTDPPVQRGDEVRIQIVTPARVVTVAEVM